MASRYRTRTSFSLRPLSVVLVSLAACVAPGCGSAESDSAVANEDAGTDAPVTDGGEDSKPPTDGGAGDTATDADPGDTSTDDGSTADSDTDDTGAEDATSDDTSTTDDTGTDAEPDDTGSVEDSTTGDAMDDTIVIPTDTGADDTGSAEDADPSDTGSDPDASTPSFTPSLGLGQAVTCGVRPDGSVSCWGENNKGQLGDGTKVDRATPATTPVVTGAVQVGAGEQFACARMAGGNVKCWGYCYHGSLGDGRSSSTTPSCPSTDDGTPTPVDVLAVTDAVELAVGGIHACVRFADADKTMMCWGYNSNGQVGIGSSGTSATKQAIPQTVLEPGAGSGPLKNVEQITVNYQHTCAVLTDKTAVCWGYNNWGALGDGTSGSGSAKTKPTPVVGLTGAVEVRAGKYHTCARHEDGTVSCWGRNNYGEIGDGSVAGANEVRTTPVKLDSISNAAQLALGEAFTCVRLTTGSVKCWGRNNLGQLGDGTSIDRPTPVDVPGITNAVDLQAGYAHACARLATGEFKCWGSDSKGQLGRGTVFQFDRPTRDPGLANVTQISLGTGNPGHGCALLADKTLKCWGRGREGQTGDLTLQDSFTPVAVSGVAAVEQVATGEVSTCVLLTGGAIKCFGNAQYGALGNGGTAPTTVAATPTPVDVSGIADAKQIALGKRFACAVHGPDDEVSCWGRNDQKQLGDGTTTNSATPVKVTSLLDVTQVAAGGEHACVIVATDASVRCWGENDNGQIGDNTTVDVGTAKKIDKAVLSGETPKKLALGENHTCLLLTNGKVRCWGDNAYGQLGDGTTTDRREPVDVTGITDATDLWAGDAFTCVRVASGNIRCWGLNAAGQLADGSFDNRSTAGPALIGLTGVSSLGLGNTAACASLADGTARCWGAIQWGQLGDGEGTYRTSPIALTY